MNTFDHSSTKNHNKNKNKKNYKRIMEIGCNSRDSFIYRKYVLLSRKHIISKIVENFSLGVYK